MDSQEGHQQAESELAPFGSALGRELPSGLPSTVSSGRTELMAEGQLEVRVELEIDFGGKWE